MFYFLSKSIDFLVMPLSICVLLLLYALATRKSGRKRTALAFAVIILFVISNTYVVNRAFLWWEPKPMDISEVAGVYDVGVVLSGGLISSNKLTADHVELGVHANRFYNAYLLYKAGKIKKILITGSSPKSWMAAGKGESRQAAAMLVSWGVAPGDVMFEENARNTRENAVFSGRILASKFPGKKVLVLTSAFHMRRAAGCFQKAGVAADYFPTDFYGINNLNLIKDIFVPNPQTVGYFDLLWHEWIGFLMYRMVGYC